MTALRETVRSITAITAARAVADRSRRARVHSEGAPLAVRSRPGDATGGRVGNSARLVVERTPCRGRACFGGALWLLVALTAPCGHAEERAANGDVSRVIEAPIAVEAAPGSDAKIQSRLLQLFASLDGLQSIAVTVNAGIVTLSGEVATKAAHRQAVELAHRVHDVVEVRDRIDESRNIWQRLTQTRDRVLVQLFDFAAYLPFLLVALGILAIARQVAERLAGSERIMQRVGANPFMRDLARQVVRITVIGAGLLLALEVMDASTLVGSLLGAAGVVGLAVGFALRDTVENYIASLLLSLRQPFARDDLISVEGWEGRVLRLTARATILMTLDGNHTRIPNATVYKAVIVNYTRNPKRRFQFDVGVDTAQNLAAAQALAADTLRRMQGVLDEPPPVCTVEQLGDSNVLLRVFGWVDQSAVEFLKVRSEAIRLVKAAFDRAGVVMPEPIYNVRFGQAQGLQGAAALLGPSQDGGGRTREHEQVVEPTGVIDIAPRHDLAGQIAAEEGGAEDLLHSRAARE